ncbi:MAG TPA: erythromycin esterase family protein [Pedobacter sp.]|uniref:erythromycin esterase family protein n=1 Tax=Pedobacter sp. TaxID=1411316 RepID=UPI002C7ED586|nr:erythromycin esterase family protein [Pedobacter sp.]HMI02184.1 erythromycin esterase family protein [Pedobacter sp.]
MLKQILLFTFIVITLSACVQKDIKTFVTENRVDIRTISPDSTDYSDLQAIGKAIGDSRIVMLGEQDHGDAPTFLAKTRLIKYLHEQKGFNVLAFESDFFALNEGWDRLAKTRTDIDGFLPDNIFSIWTKCEQCGNLLYSYIPKTYKDNKSLVITGFDSQVHGTYSLANLKIYIDSFLKRQHVKFTGTGKYKKDFYSFIDSIKYNKDIQKQRNFKEALKQIINELSTVDTAVFEMMLLKSLKANAESEISLLSKGNDYLEIRDKQMAENLRWLLKYKFPNEKIIVWAHNIHILKNPKLMDNPVWKWRNMGDFFTADKQLYAKTYVLGFNSRTGTAGRITNDKKFTVQPPVKNSFETWIPETIPYAFVDFKQFRTENPSAKTYFFMKGSFHNACSGLWTDMFDGIFYIRDMYPCTLVKIKN